MPLPVVQHHGTAILGSYRMITRDDIIAHLEDYRKALSFYRAYPDLLVDLYVEASGPDCEFKLYPYQRLILRAMARYKNVFLTFSRGTSKSFLDNLWNILQCILYPNTKLAISASTKGQSAAIVEQKFNEIMSLIPALQFEIKKTSKVKDQFVVQFKNNSFFQNLAAKQSSRGMRFTGLTIEEIIEGDETLLQEVILPTLAIPRMAANGRYDPTEPVTQQNICVTTAGLKGTYAYNMLIKDMLQMVVQPEKAIILGGSYRIPIIAGLQSMEWIRDQQRSGDLNPTSFAREFLSRWSVGSENAYFPGPVFDKYRSIQEPEWDSSNIPKTGGCVMGIDCGRFSDQSEIAIWHYTPTKGAVSTKSLVNLYSFTGMPFDQQAVEIKLLYELHQPERVVIDGNGVGAGLVDELVKAQIDYRTGQFLRPWGVLNDDKDYYRQFKTADTINNLLYVVKANATYNTEMYASLQTHLLTGKLRFLADEHQMNLKIKASRAKKFLEMTDEQKADYMVPFIQTTLLKEQMANLEEKREGVNIILDQTNKNMKKDKVSAMAMALYYIKKEIDDPSLNRQNSTLEMLKVISGQGKGSKYQLPTITLRSNGNYTSHRKR